MTPSRRKIHALIALGGVLLVAGCAPTRPPVDELDAASRALGAARAADAPTWAPAEYRSAGQRFDQAQAAEATKDYDAALQLANESQVDSELAAAKARLGKVRQEVERLREENAHLDRDLTSHAQPEDQP
jgi:hypothetical protein